LKDNRIYLIHIAEAIGEIERYSASGREAFLENRMEQDAVIRKLEVIGEAAKHLPARIKELRSEIPWREIAAMSDKMMHEYLGVNLELVWAVVDRNLLGLKRAVEELLET
jgi:uncharacterized protein with HEPN domain